MRAFFVCFLISLFCGVAMAGNISPTLPHTEKAVALDMDIDTVAFFDMESGTDEFAFYPNIDTVYWHTSDFGAYEGNSYWCGLEDVEGYDNRWLQYLESPVISLPGGAGEVTLSFQASYNCEEPMEAPDTIGGEAYDGWDGWNVRISTDGGDSWTVIVPDGGYDGTSFYAFGINAEGSDIPAFGGASDGWVSPVFDISSYAGMDVKIAIVFASDPAFCTINHNEGAGSWDPDMFGLIVDNILVSTGDGGIVFSDNAGDTGEAQMVGRNAHPYHWVTTEDESFSPTHSFVAYADPYADISLVSPPIRIPGGTDSLTFVSFYVYADLPDVDSDGDGYLDDYYFVYASDDDGITWIPLILDWARDSYAEGWSLMEEDSVLARSWSDGSPFRLELTEFAGETIRLRWNINSDPDTIGGGLYIDDVTVYTYRGLHRDVGVGYIATTPIILNVDINFTAMLINEGLDDVSGVPAFYYIFDDEMNDMEHGALAPWANIVAGGFEYKTFTWRPTVAGDYSCLVYTGLTSDENTANDSLWFDFTVPEASVRNLGYDDGMIDTFYVTSGGTTYGPFSYWFTDTTEGSAFAVGFTPGAVDTVRLTEVSYYVMTTVPFVVQIYSDADGPDMELITPVRLEPDSAGVWVRYTFPAPLDLPADEDFYVAAVLPETGHYGIYIGADMSTPHDHHSWVNPGGAGWANFEDYYIDPVNDIDLLIRAKIYIGSGITAELGNTPKQYALYQNFPNPFNPQTKIRFDLPKEDNVTIELFNILGEKVTTIVDKRLPAGRFSVTWDGTDDSGKPLPSGTYLYRLHTDNFTKMSKMLLLK